MRADIGRFLVRLGHLIGGSPTTDLQPPPCESQSGEPIPAELDAVHPETESRPLLSPDLLSTAADLSDGTAEKPVDPRQQVRQLIKQALEAPTIEQLTEFLDFTNRFRRLAVWNARMAYIQRPGAKAIASEQEWKSVGRDVLPDAVPIIILWPFSPIRFVYELADTGPPIDREQIGDPFAVKGRFDAKVLSALIANLAKAKTFKVTVEFRRQGFHYAGSAATQGSAAAISSGQLSVSEHSKIGQFATANAVRTHAPGQSAVPAFRVTLNDRLNEKERFVTLVHELGHIFCGHVGACLSGSGREDEETGWPDRHKLGKNEKEVEAEAVAYLIAARAGLVTASATYLRGYAKTANMQQVNSDLIVRAATRIERLAKIHYGKMVFSELGQPQTQTDEIERTTSEC